MTAEQRLKELNILLPEPPDPMFIYRSTVRVGNLLFVSGHGPIKTDGSWITGRVGEDLTTEEAQEAARVTGLVILSTVRNALGTLDKVLRVVKVLGMVNARSDFKEHPEVINGFSKLMMEIFGDPGKGARSAVGMGSLPNNIPVEVEAIFEVE